MCVCVYMDVTCCFSPQQVVVRMHHVSRVRGLETQLVWYISRETARLSLEGIPYCANKVQSITWILVRCKYY